MRYGAINAMWAPMESDTVKTALPKYGTSHSFDGINESNDTLNFAEASAYGDNARKLNIREFSSGTIATQEVYLPIDFASDMLGTSSDGENGQAYGGDDNAPFGGYGFICYRMDSTKTRFYETVFYPKVQAYVEGQNYKTKEDSITLEYDSLGFNIFEPECGKYKIEKRFETEDEAISYLTGLFDGSATVPGLETVSKTSTLKTKATS